jgi:pimeloyl-ACP methyl ester carboxylesterase
MKARFGDNFFYILHFQTPGVAEYELQRNVRRSLRMFLYSASGDAPARKFQLYPNTLGFLDGQVDTETLPAWLTEEDLDFYTAEFTRNGFRGPLSWYRNMDRTWELMAPFAGKKITQPALFIAGDRDGVIAANPAAAVEALNHNVPNLRDAIILPGCGHWTQQERPKEVNEALVRFIEGL